MDDSRSHVVVNQIDQYDSDILRVRATLKREFSKFGQIQKLFVEEHAKYAKVYFESFDTCDSAVKELKTNQFGWIVSHPDNTHHNFRNQKNNLAAAKRSGNSKENNNRKNSSTDTLEMEEDYLEEEFSENFDYCNVHGRPLSILQADSGEFYINLRDIKQTGFALFRRDTFDSILIDRQQIFKEFELHLLSEAKNYILKNRVSCIDEEQILQTIERCKNRLLNNSTNPINRPISRTISNTNRSEQHSQFSDNRSYRRFDVTSQEQQSEFSNNRNNNRPSDFNSTLGEVASRPRQPKTLSENFMPSNAYAANLSKSMKRDNRDNRDQKSGSSRGDSIGRDRSDFTKSDSSRSDSNRSSFRHTYRPESNKGVFDKKDFESTPEPRKFGGNRKQDQTGSRNNNTSKKSEIQREKLEIGKNYDVKICYCEPEKDNVIWVQLIDTIDHCDKMLIDISELESTAAVVNDPSNGQFVLGEYEGIWFRAEVLNSGEKLLHFIDYGNQSVGGLMKVIPEKLKDLPALAIRMVINFNSEKPTEGADLTVVISRQYDDGTYLANTVSKSKVIGKTHEQEITLVSNIPTMDASVSAADISTPSSTQKEDLEDIEKSEEVNSRPSEISKSFLVDPEPLTALKDGDMVMFSERISNKFALKTKGCVEKSKELIAYIKELDKSALVMTNVTEGQMVLCSKEGVSGLCRATVKEVRQSNVVTVKYIDYPGEDLLTLKSLRNVDEHLSKQPSALLMTPDIWYLNNLNLDAINFITELVGRKEKAVVVLTEKGMDFRLENKQLLSEVIEKKLPSSSAISEPLKQSRSEVKREESVTKQKAAETLDEKIIFDNMDWIKLNPGEYEFICYHIKDVRDITMVSTLDEHVKYMEDIADIPDPDNKSYKPEIYEMCLVHYTEDTEGFWYRGVVLEIDGTDYTILMVDFGNETTVSCEKIRKFPAKLQNIPILGLACDFKSLPNSPMVNGKLKELLQDNQDIKTVVKGFDDETLKYIIDIPQIREQIMETGLC